MYIGRFFRKVELIFGNTLGIWQLFVFTRRDTGAVPLHHAMQYQDALRPVTITCTMGCTQCKYTRPAR